MSRDEQLKALQDDVDVLAAADEGTALASLPYWDSLAILLVISHFEQAYGMEIKGSQVRACRTVADILDLSLPHR